MSTHIPLRGMKVLDRTYPPRAPTRALQSRSLISPLELRPWQYRNCGEPLLESGALTESPNTLRQFEKWRAMGFRELFDCCDVPVLAVSLEDEHFFSHKFGILSYGGRFM